MDHGINSPVHGNNVVGGNNDNKKRSFKEKMELVGNSNNNNTTNIGIIPYASKYGSIFFQNNACLFSLIRLNLMNLQEVKKVKNR